MGGVGALGDLLRAHVHHRDPGRAGVRAQADELPRESSGLQPRDHELQGPSASHERVREGAPLRAVGRPPRAPAGARVHPGRRPHLLHPGADHRRVPGGVRAHPEHLPRFRLRGRAHQVRRPARNGGSDRTRSGTGRRRRSGRRSNPPGSTSPSIPAREPSTGPSWSSSCATRLDATGSAAPSRSTSTCRSGWGRPTSARTAASTFR